MRYIWIDSLCIIQQQDSKDDWLRESPQMGMIYSNSYCNIAATGASDGNDGLFKPRCPHTVFPSAIRNPHRDFELHLTHEHHWEAELLDAPLLERGWVLQERILSPRILHFGRRQLLWECCESEASERLPDQLPSLPVAHQYAGYKSSLTLHPDGGQGLPSTENDPFARASIHALWNRLVSAYSRTNLTYPEDKLIAIAGIAAKIQSGLKTDYLAGLWGDRLTSQLLWRVEQPSRRERPRCYRAPSFSWASVDGTIIPPDISSYAHATIHIRILRVQIDYPGSNSTGPVTGGRLFVEGLLKLLDNDIKIELDTKLAQEVGKEHLFLPIVRNNIAPWLWKGLVLERISAPSNQYCRVGMASLSDREWKRLTIPERDDATGEVYDSSTGKCRICII